MLIDVPFLAHHAQNKDMETIDADTNRLGKRPWQKTRRQKYTTKNIRKQISDETEQNSHVNSKY